MTNGLGQRAIAFRTSGLPFPGITGSAFIKGPVQGDDSLLDPGADSWSLQFNASATALGYQNVLRVFPDRLVWSIAVWSKAGVLLGQNDYATLTELNETDLANTLVSFMFYQGGEAVLEIRDALTTRLLIGEHLQLPGPWVSDVLSASVEFLGAGDSSKATFNELSATIHINTDPSVTDLDGFCYPYDLPTPPPSIFTSTEGSTNTYQMLQLAQGNSLQAMVGIGGWIR